MLSKLIIIFLALHLKLSAQFSISGELNTDFEDAIVFLNVIDDINKQELFLVENIIAECQVDSNKEFTFNVDFLPSENKIYKIHIDNCRANINDTKHLYNECDDCLEILFIANNKSNIHFPLNNLDQSLCSFSTQHSTASAIYKVDSIKEVLFSELVTTKSDNQRRIIYTKSFKELRRYSQSFNEPLIELYAFQLYSSENSLLRESYLESLKETSYYDNLSHTLSLQYPNSTYYKNYLTDLKKDIHLLSLNPSSSLNLLTWLLALGFIISIVLNISQFKKLKQHRKNTTIDYKKTLTKQECKVFELMNKQHSNKEIAEQLFVSLSTIKTHINNIYSKLSIHSRKDIHQFFK